MRIKFLHAADLHLDSPFAALPPEQAARRRREQRELLGQIVELCNGEQCNLLLLAGDLFDGATVYPDTLEVLQHQLARCRALVFISPGNHDPYGPDSPYTRSGWPKNVHFFTEPSMQGFQLPHLDLELWGAAFTGPSAPSLLDGFRVSGERPAIVLLHGDAQNAASPYNAITTTQLEQCGADYVALGHIHAPSGLLHAGKTAYAWPGCAMGRGFDETGPRGVYVGTLTEEGCDLQFHPLDSRRYLILTVEAGADPRQSIVDTLPPETENDIYRIVLTGPSPRLDVISLEESLAPRFFGLTIVDETYAPRDLWEARGQDTLRGLFLQALYERRAEDRELYEMAAQLGVAALDGREVPEL